MRRLNIFLMTVVCMSFAPLLQAVSTPDISRIYGDYFVPEVAQYQSQGPVGTLDPTFGTSGSQSLAAQLASSQAKASQIVSDGSVLVVLDDGTNSKVVKYTATGALYTTTGGTFGTSSACALTGLTSVTGMMLDSQGRILVFGNNNGSAQGWLRRITSAGVVDSSFTFVDANWTAIGAISFINTTYVDAYSQTVVTEDIIVVGRNASSTPVVARVSVLPTNSTSGGIDTTFGTTPGSGYTSFNGNATDQYDVVVTNLNAIFISYKDATSGYASIAKYTVAGALETAYNSTGIIPQSLGAITVTAGQLRLALDASGNVVIAGYNGSNAIYVASYPQADSGSITPVLSPFSLGVSAHALQLSAMITTTDGNIMLLGSDTASKLMTVWSITSAGVLDTNFNSNGVLQFYAISAPGTSSILLAGAIAPDGELYAVGYQVNSGTTTPYLSAIYNEMYVTQVAQYPTTTQQGSIDLSFGLGQTIGGVVRSFNGVYGSNLEQTANTVIELASGKLLVGMSGFLNTSASSNMMLSLLNADGTLNANYSLTQHSPNEYLTGIIQNADTTLLVCGYSSATPGGAATGLILRKYTSTGTEVWQTSLAGAGYKALGMLTQGSGRVLLFMQISATAGAIAAFNPSNGTLDSTFNSAGVTPGMIKPTDFAGTPLAAMGPVYGYALDIFNAICIAYKNSSTGFVDVAKINLNGSGMVTSFGYSGGSPTGTGISPNILGVTITNVQDVRMCRTYDNSLQLNVAYGTGYLLSQPLINTGALDLTYGTSGIFTLTGFGTTTAISGITYLQNNKMYVFGKDTTVTDSMIIFKFEHAGVYPLAGILDTTFNAQGPTPGVLSLQVPNLAPSYTTRVATGLIVQAASGNLVMSAYEQSGATESIPMAMHVYGTTGELQVNQNNTGNIDVAGTIDTTFGNNAGAEDLTALIAAGAAKVIYAYRSSDVNSQYILVGIDTGSSTVIARILEHDLSLDLSFGTGGSGKITLSGSVAGVNTITVDNQNNIIVGGSTGGTTGWIHRLNNAGTTDTVFTMPSGFKSVNMIKQQESGRYIAAGIDTSSKGALVAFQDIASGGTFHVDTTFNPLGGVPGVYEITTTAGLYSLSINSDDTIFTAYSDTGSGHVNIQKVQANGIGIVTSFNSGLALDTGIVPTNASSIHCAIDTNNNIVVASSVGGNSVSVMRYTFNGAIDNTFNPVLGVGTIKTITGLGSAGVVIARLMIDTNNKIIVIGNNTSGANGLLYATRLTSTGVLDTTWNNSPTGADVQGILTYTIDGSTNAYDATIFTSGEVLVAGLGTTNKPLIIAILGDAYVTQVSQQPYQVAAGIIDTTLDTITPGSGALNLQSYLPGLSLASSTAQKLYIYPSGAMLIAFNQGTSTILANLNAAQVLNTSGFNSGAVGSPAGSVTIANAATITDLFVNNGTNGDNNIYMTGLNAGTLWTAQVSATGTVQSFTTTDTLSMTSVTRIRRSTNSRTLISGYAAGSIGRGIIAAYKSDESGLDLSFGGGLGYYKTGISSPIADMQLDQYDRMYIAYVNGSTILIDRVESDGTTTQAWSAFGTNISVTTASQIRLAIDQTNNQLVVAVQDGTSASNTIRVRRYNLTTGANTCAGEIDISTPGDVVRLAELFIDNAQNIYVVGYDSTVNNVLVAKINSTGSTTMALDVTYGVAATGIVDVSAGSNLTIVTSGALDPDRRVYVVGSQATPTPAMARLFGYPYVTELSTANPAGTPGLIDLTVDGGSATPNGSVVLNTLTNWAGLSGYTAVSIYTNADGSAYILFTNGVSFQIGKVTGDMNAASGFGTNGLTSPVTLATTSDITVDSQGRILVSGTTSGGAQAVYRFSTSGTLLTTFASTLTSLNFGGCVQEQQSGRILVAGQKGSSGCVNAYQNTGLAQDTTYGPPALAGWYATGVNSSVDDACIDTYDNVYLIYRNVSDSHVYLEKINDSGSYKVAAFHGGATVDTGIVATQKAQIAINSAGNILVGASTASGVQTALYNGTTGVIIGSIQTITSANTPILTALTAAGTTFEGSVYTTQPMMIAFRILGSTGLLDGSFGTAGLASYELDAATHMNDIAVQVDGRIVMVGVDGSPLLMRLYGTPYLPQQVQGPDAAPVGTLDVTINPPTGALDLNTLLSTGSLNLAASAVKRIYQYGNGVLLLMFDNGTNTTLVRLLKDFTLDPSFGSGTPLGYVTISGKYNATGLSVDPSGNIYASGGLSAGSWTAAFNSNGTTLTGWSTPVSNLTNGGYAIGVQSLNRIIVAGQNSNGTLIGYTNTGALDVTFGVNGIVTTGYAAPIVDLSINGLNQINIVTVNGGVAVLQQVSADGSAITTLNSGTAITNITDNNARVIQDSSGNIIVGAATTSGFTLRRYTSTGVNNPSTPVTISTGGVSTSYIGNIYVTSDNKVVLAGYTFTGNNIVVTRLNSSFVFDPTFNSGAPLITTVGNMNLVYDATIDADDRTLVVGGSQISADPYMARVFGDAYVTAVSQSQTIQSPGVNDTTFGLTGSNGVLFYASPGATSAQNQVARSVTMQGYDRIVVGLDGQDTTNTQNRVFLNAFTGAGVLDTTFNTTGQVEVPHYYTNENIRNLMYFSQGGINKAILAGYATSGTPLNVTGSWLMQFNLDSAVVDSSFGGLFQAGSGVAFGDAQEFFTVGRQSTGRVITSGLNYDNSGVVLGYTDTGILDTSFGANGYFSPGTVGLYTHAIDTKNRVVIAYNNGSNVVAISRILANGSGLDTTFGSGGTVTTGIAGLSGNTQINVVVDGSGNVLVVAINNSGANYVIRRYNPAGNTYVELVIAGAANLGSSTAVSLGQLIVDADGKAIITGTCTDGSGQWMLIVRTNTGITALDTTFNPLGTPGYLKYKINGSNSTRQLTDGIIHPDGRIIVVGSETL